MYAYISALEIDLREFLILHVMPIIDQGSLLPSTTQKKATERFLKDNPDLAPDQATLLDYIDLDDEINAIQKHDKKLDSTTRTYIKKYYIGFIGLIPIRNRVMHSRPLEYDDLMKVSNLASGLIHSHRTLWSNLRTTSQRLKQDPDFAATLNIPDAADDTTNILHNLPQPEFDDTGFIGRERELSDLKRALASSYPVVTVIGEGGLGKTALALKACYDLLDDNHAGYDAIVWTTAKTTKLTLHEIHVIEGAVSSSLGIIESATSVLGRQDGASALNDLIMHLKYNKILLVIDNLETVIDQTIRDLVSRIPKGSRILFTTRIGLGAYEFPVPILPLSAKDAAFYFRITARVWGMNDLASAAPQLIDGYCDYLQKNTLFIKWFIQSLRAGKRPTALITDPSLFLRFCLQNVFNVLPAISKTLAGTLASLNEAQTIASLAFYTGLDSISIQSALSKLITSNLVVAVRAANSQDEERYTLSTLSQMYIRKFIRPSTEEQRMLISKQKELRAAQEDFASREGTDIFDINFVYIRDKDDYIVAKLLTRAVEHIFKGRLGYAESDIEKASDLSPNYFEVHRVKALLNVAQEDLYSAKAEYEAALSLAPDRAPLRSWYGGFLSRYFGDHDGALVQLFKAEELAPSSALVKLECARVLQYKRRFGEAAGQLNGIKDIAKQSSRTRRVYLDLLLQNEVRNAVYLAGIHKFEEALSCLEKTKEIFEGTPNSLVDQRTVGNLSAAERCFPALRRAFSGLPEARRLLMFERWLPQVVATFGRNRIGTSGAQQDLEEAACAVKGTDNEAVPNRGRLTELHSSYGFVDTGGNRYFFHRGQWTGQSDFIVVGEGTVVQFDTEVTERGICAINVQPILDRPSAEQSDKQFLGSVKSLSVGYGFINLDTGGDLFFSRNNCCEGTPFNSLVVGERVRCKITLDEKNRPQGDNVESYSGL